MSTIGSAYYTNYLQNQFSKLQDAQAKAQTMIATGRRFVQASEAPTAAIETQKISLRRQELESDETRRDLARRVNDVALLTAQQTRNSLDEVSLSIELAFETGTDAVENANLGRNIDQAIEQAVAMLNYNLDGRYLFGGNETSTPPFEIVRDAAGGITSVDYAGSTEGLSFDVGLNVRMDPAGDPALNAGWAGWMNELLAAKQAFEADDVTASRDALKRAGVASETAFASTTDIIAKSLRIETLTTWSQETNTQLANQEASLQEIDLNDAILQFNELQRNYQASLQSGRLLLTLSLVDFL